MIAIITDSTCDIPQALIEQYGIIVISHIIIWGDDQFRDRTEMTPLAFYERLETDSVRPTTSQASVADFLAGVNQARDNGAEEALILTVSSEMSGAYEMAKGAAEQSDIPVTVIDSKGPSMSLGWQVLAAARARDEGASVSEIVDTVDQVRANLVQIVAMETIEYLKTGGRIGDAAKWVGARLKVKPVVSINFETGRVSPAGLARTKKSKMDMLNKKFFDALDTGKKLHIAVLHGNAPKEAEQLAERIRDEFDPAELIVNITGPVLGVNTGPGALSLAGYAED